MSEPINPTKKQFEAIGEYVYYFEKLVGNIRIFVIFMLDFRGLDSITISGIVLGNKVFTAGPLMDLCASIFGDQTNRMYKDDLKEEVENLIERFNHFKKEFIRLTQKRNEILHSSYFINPDSGELISIISRPNKKGFYGSSVPNVRDIIIPEISKMHDLDENIRKILSKYALLLDQHGLKNQAKRNHSDFVVMKNRKK